MTFRMARSPASIGREVMGRTSFRRQAVWTAYTLKPGHRLVLVVASQDSRQTNGARCWNEGFDEASPSRCYSPSGILPAVSAGRATNTVLLGSGLTALRLAWADPAALVRAPGVE
jgi:hypothetical protein